MSFVLLAHRTAFAGKAYCLVAFLNVATYGAVHAITPAAFPDHLRGTALGIAQFGSMLAGIVSGQVIGRTTGSILAVGGVQAASLLFAAMAGVGVAQSTRALAVENSEHAARVEAIEAGGAKVSLSITSS